MTAVRGKRGKHVHVTADLRMALCGIKVDGFILTPNVPVTCVRCLNVVLDIHENGN